jgi:hypothetical protein
MVKVETNKNISNMMFDVIVTKRNNLELVGNIEEIL